MSLKDKKIYIIGQGIAGSVLAFLLHQKGYDIRVIDDGHLTSSSTVAAGMWNPVSFKRMSQSWMADDLLPVADRVYREMETALDASFFHPMDLVKIFPDNKTANSWDEYSVSAEIGHYLSSEQNEQVKQQLIQAHGHGVVKHSGWLDMHAMLQAASAFFKKKELIEISSFTKQNVFEILNVESNTLIIFATGTNSTSLFSDMVNIIPNKGEVLTIESNELNLSCIVNFGKFLIPLGENRFRIGATYDWNRVEAVPTDEGKQNILSHLNNHYKKNVTIVNHVAGYRPTTKDRRPVIGLHPDNRQLAFFNGFGSKGVMLIPYFATHFIEFLEGKTALIKEVNVERYFKNFE